MKKCILLCLLLMLLLSAGCAEDALSAASVPRQVSAAETAAPAPVGHGSFAEAGDITPAQQQIILQYMDAYYESLASLQLQFPTELFAEESALSAAANRAVWEYLIELRAMQQQDFSLLYYEYDMTWLDPEDYIISEDETAEGLRKVLFRRQPNCTTVLVDEHSIQRFAAYPDTETESTWVGHLFTLQQQQDGSWRIAAHLQLDSTHWLITGDYVAETRAEDDAALRRAVRYFKQRRQNLLLEAAKSAAARSREAAPDVNCHEPYDREAAAAYALEWIGRRNYRGGWQDYSFDGGNCQNFASQCLHAGGIPMDITGYNVWKWYDPLPNNANTPEGRSGSWSGVKYFLSYARDNRGYGLDATVGAPYYSGEPGDLMHLGAEGEDWKHAVVITEVICDENGEVQDYLICSNTADLKNFPVSIYPYPRQLLIKINGWNRY